MDQGVFSNTKQCVITDGSSESIGEAPKSGRAWYAASRDTSKPILDETSNFPKIMRTLISRDSSHSCFQQGTDLEACLDTAACQ